MIGSGGIGLRAGKRLAKSCKLLSGTTKPMNFKEHLKQQMLLAQKDALQGMTIDIQGQDKAGPSGWGLEHLGTWQLGALRGWGVVWGTALGVGAGVLCGV